MTGGFRFSDLHSDGALMVFVLWFSGVCADSQVRGEAHDRILR